MIRVARDHQKPLYVSTTCWLLDEDVNTNHLSEHFAQAKEYTANAIEAATTTRIPTPPLV